MVLGTLQQVGNELVRLRLVTQSELESSLADLRAPTPDELLTHLQRQSLLTSLHVQKLENGETSGYYLGRFKVLYLINAGTFARVYRSIDPSTGEPAAVKVLRTRHEKKPTMVEQFERESNLIGGFDHPNIIRIIEAGVDPFSQQHFFSMDFVEGGNFREFMRIRKRLDPAEWHALAVQMIDGLRYALSHGVTHRDIKPSNVLFAADGRMRWIDFGLGGTVVRVDDIEQYRIEQRTIDYATLEKWTNAPRGDPRSDIFFLGAVFYHMLSGEPAMPDVKDKIVRASWSRFVNIGPLSQDDSVPARIGAIVDRMMASRPQDRYQDYDSLLRDVQAVGDGSEPEPVAETVADEVPRLMIIHRSKTVRRNLRAKFSKIGYRIAVLEDSERALTIFKLTPPNCVIVDLETTGPEGVEIFFEMQRIADSLGRRCSAVFLATDEQMAWTNDFDESSVVTLRKPVTLGPVYKAVRRFTRVSKDVSKS